jgi:catechol 2,3-dioxygenase-like lactoylglutathione lyase family enzyme
MIAGAHVIVYSRDVEADRAFFRDVLRMPNVDAGDGWLIFALPAAEIALHPAEQSGAHELYFMCPDLFATMADLASRGVTCERAVEERWGLRTRIPLPGGGHIGLYQPKHPTAIEMKR